MSEYLQMGAYCLRGCIFLMSRFAQIARKRLGNVLIHYQRLPLFAASSQMEYPLGFARMTRVSFLLEVRLYGHAPFWIVGEN